jgi:hypothetical protein
MPVTLQEILLAPASRPAVIGDCLALIEQEVSDKSGVSGTAIKLAYKTAKTLTPGYLRKTMESVLPGIADKLQPYWADFGASGGSEFGDYLAKRGPEVSEDLLSVSDGHAAASERPVIIRAYRSVRGNASTHVEAALPRVGQLAQKYAA